MGSLQQLRLLVPMVPDLMAIPLTTSIQYQVLLE
jgi:hypothetical protein